MAHLWTEITRSLLASTGNLLHTPSLGEGPFTGADLTARAERTAGILLSELDGKKPRSVGILMGNGESWVRAALATLRLDAALVPLSLPVASAGTHASIAHLQKISESSDLDVILIDGSLGSQFISQLVRGVPRVRIVDIRDGVQDSTQSITDLPALGGGGGSPAVLQYTSGSTSNPKGVLLSHDNVAAGLDAIVKSTQWSHEERLGQWLPLFHDMGLFILLTALRSGSPVHMWQPRDFVRKPMAWLSEFAESQCTYLVAPNFFYDRLTQAAAADGIPNGLDLTAWRYAANGSEPVRAKSLEDFQRTFAEHGLAPHVVQPAYGMAEATLLVSTSTPRGAWRVLSVDRRCMSIGDKVRLTEAADSEARVVVSCGGPIDNMRVRVGDVEGNPLPEGTIGELQIAGASITAGYLGVSDEQQPFTKDGLLRTGDIGFVFDGEIYIAGRLKAMVVVRGQNYYAEDVEEIVGTTPGVERRRCAAFVRETDGSENLVVMWETRLDEEAATKVVRQIRQRLADELGLGATEILPVGVSSLPVTSSGKVKRAGAADLYRSLRGES